MKYTKSHEWVQINEGIGTVGISNYAQEELGNIVFAELPSIGKKLTMGQEAAILESTKAAADIYTPVSGIVVEINPELEVQPNLINSSSEEKGWLFKLQLSNPNEEDSLLSEKEYQDMIKA